MYQEVGLRALPLLYCNCQYWFIPHLSFQNCSVRGTPLYQPATVLIVQTILRRTSIIPYSLSSPLLRFGLGTEEYVDFFLASRDAFGLRKF